MTSMSTAVATVTLVRAPGEELILRAALTSLAASGLPICVADGGSDPAFTAFLATLDNVNLAEPRGPGLVGQVAAAVEGASAAGAEYVLYTESDKQGFFETGLEAFLRSASPLTHPPSLVLAARTPASFETYPGVQRHTEGMINDLCGESFGVAGDYSYGPFVMHRSLVPWVARIAPDLGWGWRHFIFAVAHRLGHRVVHVTGEFACPEDQRAEDDRERLHRLKQLDQNVSGLQAGLAVPLG